jgi:hypothetical protein
MNVIKFNNYLGYLYTRCAMDVKKIQQLFRRPTCRYCNGCKKTYNYLEDLYVNIAMDVKNISNYLKDLYVSITDLKWRHGN